MLRVTAKRAVTAWIAILAVLLGSIAPTISHSIGFGAASSWVEVCTAQGSKWVQADAAPQGSPQAPAAGHSFEHCGLCLVHAHGLGLPPPPLLASLGTLAQAQEFPAAFLESARTQHAWVKAQPRAPPFVS